MSKEKVRTLEEIERKQTERIQLLESDNQELLQDNEELKEALKQFTSQDIVESSDEETMESEPAAAIREPDSPEPELRLSPTSTSPTVEVRRPPQRRPAQKKEKPKQDASGSPKSGSSIQFTRSKAGTRYESMSVT